MRSSPWWYRRRDAMFGAIYGIGFFSGGLVSGFQHGRYIPLYVEIAGRFGSNGFTAAAAILVAMMAACFALRLWGSSYLQARIVWSEDASADALVVAGPFRFTRNPLYLGNVLMAASFGAFAPVFGWIVINVLDTLFIFALVRWEERGLRERYGSRFAEYCRNVPALLPRIPPARATSFVKPSLKEGLVSEIFTGGMLLAMIALVLAPGIYGLTIFAALFFGGFALQHAAAGRKAQTGQVT